MRRNEAGSSLSLAVSVRKYCVVALFLILWSSSALAQTPREFIRGVDVSHLDRVEERGAVFRDNGVAGDALVILQNHGVNWVRLRLWHSPADGYNGLERTVQLAERVKAAGMGFLLDIHYSDTWADPGRQTKPAAWQNASFEALRDSVRAYTGYVLARFQDAGAEPDMVQVGNEITSGMLWNTGRVGGNYDTPAQWHNLAELLKSGIEAVRASGDSIEVMIHIDRGGSYSGSTWFFDNLADQGVDFDVIGLSYYPWWHGRLSALEYNLSRLAPRYGKDIVLVETAYPWTTGWSDNENNIVGEGTQLNTDYPASVAGQGAFLSEVFSIVRNTPYGRGLVYWEPAHIPAPGFGSPWENLALFNFQGNLLASADAFAPASDVAAHEDEAAASTEVSVFPNPFGTSTRIQYVTDKTLLVELRIYDALGRLVHGPLAATGSHEFVLATGDLVPGLYLYRFTTEAGPATVGLLIRR